MDFKFTYDICDSVEKLEERIKKVREAQKIFATYTQEQVDKIFLACAIAANKARIPLAKLAVEETGMGVVEDKVIKNNYAAEYIYNKYKFVKTCGVIEEDKAYGFKKIAEPIGLISAVIPTTNPTSTAIFKTLICLKTRNGVIISPHPRAKKSTIAAAKVVYEAAVEAGAPEGRSPRIPLSSSTATIPRNGNGARRKRPKRRGESARSAVSRCGPPRLSHGASTRERRFARSFFGGSRKEKPRRTSTRP